MTTFEHTLIDQCAPTLLGQKQACLFSCKNEENSKAKAALWQEIMQYKAALSQKGITLRPLYACKSRLYLMVYREKLMQRYFQTHMLSYFLEQYGYPHYTKDSVSVDAMLSHLESRLDHLKDFPHEIGFFLGYPAEDVKHFIHEKGANAKFCGYWKVYGNEEEAKKLFARYSKCREVLCRRATTGIPVMQLLGVS